MLRPISTLKLSSSTVAELNRQGIYFIDEVLKKEDVLSKCPEREEIEKQLQLPEGLAALDVWQLQSQRECISIFCSELNAVLGNGFQCQTITELCGAPFTGKSQMCMQLSVSVQLKKQYGGLDGRAIYIDSRNGTSALRIRDIVNGYNKYYSALNLIEAEVFENIDIYTPWSTVELFSLLDTVEDNLKILKNNKQVRLLIVDSLSLPVLCCIDDPIKRIHFYSDFLYKLHLLTTKYKIIAVITNEMITQIDKEGHYFASAGGQYMSNYVATKLELTRITNEKFAARLLKSSTMPQVSVLFKITEDGIRNVY